MELLETCFDAVKLLAVRAVADNRGWKSISYSAAQWRALGNEFVLQQENIYRPRPGAFFGIHFQNHPQAQAKLITLLSGHGLDYVVDLRHDSPTYRHWRQLALDANGANTLYIPPGFGHGFLACSADVLMAFKVDCAFDPELSLAISYKDPALALPLQIDESLLSEQDRLAPTLAMSHCNL